MSAMNHSDLVLAAAKWLQKKRCSVVITEIATAAMEHPDAIGWYGPNSILVECKASRSDFLADAAKAFRVNPWQGIGRSRYLLTTPGIVAVDEIPNRWGLLELTSDRVRTVREAETFNEINERHEIAILLSALRRIGKTAPVGMSIKCYTIETLNRATIGIELEPEATGV